MPSFLRAVFGALALVVCLVTPAKAQPCLDSLIRTVRPGNWIRVQMTDSTRIAGHLLSIDATSENPTISLRLQDAGMWHPSASTRPDQHSQRDTILVPAEVAAYDYRTGTRGRQTIWMCVGTTVGAFLGYLVAHEDNTMQYSGLSNKLTYSLLGGAVGLGVSFFSTLANNPTMTIRCR